MFDYQFYGLDFFSIKKDVSLRLAHKSPYKSEKIKVNIDETIFFALVLCYKELFNPSDDQVEKVSYDLPSFTDLILSFIVHTQKHPKIYLNSI